MMIFSEAILIVLLIGGISLAVLVGRLWATVERIADASRLALLTASQTEAKVEGQLGRVVAEMERVHISLRDFYDIPLPRSSKQSKPEDLV